ncbi:acetolactate synthase [Aspergillus steynii IBT 23096]|uniref:Acetolactate synthase n=1 Tax=Aspergillus steynii IBT 23096 TaxID=1392250 RepID=A0A2I2GB54_9EURO|nr:acetolactate synthase [Aspergillus steynii IBT 23096]PLB50077.1 acetolactate synthase [Aspergillus steynii IBT 23096]
MFIKSTLIPPNGAEKWPSTLDPPEYGTRTISRTAPFQDKISLTHGNSMRSISTRPGTPVHKSVGAYTASFAFFEALWELGVKNCFVNLGSDHPSIMEAMAKGHKERRDQFPRIFTCPNEMVALSMADGYARRTNSPQCVIIHVDVGTSGLGAAIHNASIGRAPVLIFAGLSPITQEGEMRGSRTEYIHWLQDVPDQKQIVAQYCRYVGEVRTGKNIKQMVGRALQFATSDPKGPVYLMGAREVMEEDIQPYPLHVEQWRPVEPTALPETAVELLAHELVQANQPLLITGYSGRNHECVEALLELADTVKGLRVLDTGGCDMCFPATHPGWLGLKYGSDASITTADLILVIDCDVPWIPTQCRPQESARIFHIDLDPLKTLMPLFYVPALRRYAADACTAVRQINSHLRSSATLQSSLSSDRFSERWTTLREQHCQLLKTLDSKASRPQDQSDSAFNADYLCKTLRDIVPEDTIFAIEAVTNSIPVSEQIRATLPGQWINCGGGGLGWSGGGALGIKLAVDAVNQAQGSSKTQMVVQIVGDGSYLFTVPSSVYWILHRYQIPILTIVLNNKGWNAPRRSMLLVHPDGIGSEVDNGALNISFEPSPDCSGIARAASDGHIHAVRVADAGKLDSVLREAVRVVQSGTSAVVDAHVS